MQKSSEIRSRGEVRGCILGLHGRGVTGKDLASLAEAMALDGVQWVFPDGPLDFPGSLGGRAWFEHSPHHARGILLSRKKIFEWIGELEGESVPADRIALVGFSQGAVVALDAGVRYPRRLAGIVGMSGFLVFPETLAAEKSPSAKGLPILLTHGKNDEVLPVEGSREAQAVLRAEGFSVRLREYLMGHEVVAETLSDVREFLNGIFGTTDK